MRANSLAAVVVGALVVGCSSSTVASGVASPEPGNGSNLPSDYRFVLKSSCGERGLLGRYKVVVRDGRVSSVTSLNTDYPYQPALAEVPTLQGLLEKARSARAKAAVDLELDEAGLPKRLAIDHVPNGVDDEECYEVSELSE